MYHSAVALFILMLTNGFHGFHGRGISVGAPLDWRRREARGGTFRSGENRVRKATLQRRARGRGGGGQSSQSLGHSQYGSLWCNRDAEAPCFCAFGERSPTLRQTLPPTPPPPPLPLVSSRPSQPSLRQSDSLSLHILRLICQPKPSGPVGQSGDDGSPTSLFSHCISTPANINHGGSTLAHPAATTTTTAGRGFCLIPVRGKRSPRETATDFLLQFPLFGCSLWPAGNSYTATSCV